MCVIDVACGDNKTRDSVAYEKNTENGEFSPDQGRYTSADVRFTLMT